MGLTLQQIAGVACAKVGRNDQYALTIAGGLVVIRHQYVYDSFDWRNAQVEVTVPVTVATGDGEYAIPGIDRIISVRYWREAIGNSKFLDPVSTEFLYETGYDFPEGGASLGNQFAARTPTYYIERYDQDSQQRIVRLYPPPNAEEVGDGVNITVLGRKPFNAAATSPLLPYIDSLLIDYVTADLLETFRQTGKSQAKLAEADKLLADAQARDTPPITRPRMSKVLTVSGNSLEELTDSVCDIIGDWKPDTRISVKERVRRNYQTLWEMALWPESTVVARVYATDNEQIILPHYFDRIISVRSDANPSAELANQEVSIFFNIDPQIFERVGDPLYYSMLPPVGVAVLPPRTEALAFYLGNDSDTSNAVSEAVNVFIKGEANGSEISESLTVASVPSPNNLPNDAEWFGTLPRSAFDYNTPITIAKPVTRNPMRVYGVDSKRVLLNLGPQERERKYIRIWLLPNKTGDALTNPQSYLVLGKKAISPLVDDADTCQLRNVENILINGAAADMLDKIGNAALAATLRTKAAAASQIMVDGETNQNASNPVVIPYVEGFSGCGTSDISF
jgi:hypothetical protein